MEKLKSAHKEQNLEEIDSAMEALNKAFQEASAEMYANAQAAQPEVTPEGSTGSSENDIQDASFEEVKED